MSSNKKISDIIDFNPKRPIKKGDTHPFIEMAALPVNSRDINKLDKREFKGGGSKFKNGDTLFARITPCLENGKTAKVNCLNDGEYGHGSTEFIVMAAKNPDFDEDYIYYLARHPEFRAYAQSLMEGTSGRQRVAWQSLAEFEFNYPNKNIRKTVGGFLKIIDDKIAINTQINQTLEQIAQAIFKSWFVDFDPVKAKIATLEAGGSDEEVLLAAMQVISSKNSEELTVFEVEKPKEYVELRKTAELFPSAMVDSELGEIPEGWEVWKVKDFGQVVCGKTPPKKNVDYYDGEIPFIKIPDTHGKIFITETNETLTEEGSKSQLNKLIPNNTVCVSCIATVGQVFITSKPSHTNQQINSLIPKNEYYLYYLLFKFKSMNKHFHDLASGGSATLNMNTRTFSNIEVLKPKEKLIFRYQKVVNESMKKILANQRECNNLARLRDTLLPKLLSGELDVSQLSDQIEAEA